MRSVLSTVTGPADLRIPLHAEVIAGDSPLVLAVVALGMLGAALLLGLALAAFVRRQSRPYLLVVAAIAALLARSLVAGLWMVEGVGGDAHHLVEHGLDVVMVALVVAAVYYARTAPREVDAA